jgi:glucose/arabinose dehydrogenase
MRHRQAAAVIAIAAAVLVLDGGPRAQSALRTRVHASGFTQPVAFVQDPTSRAVQFVVEQGGRIRVIRDGLVQEGDFLDLRGQISAGGERGLLGLAFAPDYATSGRFFVNYTNTAGDTVIGRYRRSPNPLAADPSTRFDLRLGDGQQRSIEQPFSNHNGGHLAFGPDGYLYIGLGDGGSGNDPDHRAQTPGTVLGKMLRIDVDVPDSDPAGYAVPADNPFIGSAPLGTRPEIWAFGLRNPWRYSFDSANGALIIADVGQGRREEINYEPRGQGGRNYGWRNREGTLSNDTSRPPAFTPLTDPIHEYDRSAGASISGGFVYRGTALGAAHQGRYFFGDFISSRVWSIGLTITPANGEATASARTDHTSELGGAGALGNVASFGVDADQELYIVSYGRGEILRLTSTATAPSAPTGLRIIRE